MMYLGEYRVVPFSPGTQAVVRLHNYNPMGCSVTLQHKSKVDLP